MIRNFDDLGLTHWSWMPLLFGWLDMDIHDFLYVSVSELVKIDWACARITRQLPWRWKGKDDEVLIRNQSKRKSDGDGATAAAPLVQSAERRVQSMEFSMIGQESRAANSVEDRMTKSSPIRCLSFRTLITFSNLNRFNLIVQLQVQSKIRPVFSACCDWLVFQERVFVVETREDVPELHACRDSDSCLIGLRFWRDWTRFASFRAGSAIYYPY